MYYSVQHLMLNDGTANLVLGGGGFGLFFACLFVFIFRFLGFLYIYIYKTLKNISYPDPIATLGKEGKTFSLILGNST